MPGTGGLSADERDRLERLPAEERGRTEAQITSLQRDFDAIVDASGLVATDDEHDPEGSTIAFERAQVAALLAGARRRRGAFGTAVDDPPVTPA